MTTTLDPLASTAEATAEHHPTSRSRSAALPGVGGAALVLGVALFAAGMITSPASDSRSAADYIASLSRDPLLTAVSALLLHWGNVALGLGVLAAPSLLRGRRGARLVAPGAVLCALGFVNTSGLVLSDWWNAAAGRQLGSAQAVALFDAVWGGPLLQLWRGTQPLAFLGLLLVLVGLVRGGVLRWWVVLLVPVGFAGAALAPLSLPWLGALGATVTLAPLALVGLRLLGRWRLARR